MENRHQPQFGLDSRQRAARWAGVVLGAAAIAWLTGCGADSSGPDPNLEPETNLVAAPQDSSRVQHHVTFEWNGRDADGTVRQFDYLLDTYPREVATIDQVQRTIPAPTDPRWVRIAAYRLELTVLADVLRADPRGDIGAGEFDRWHSFFLRAVDEDGALDPTPEVRTFQAFTLAPRLWLQEPLRRGETVTLPRTVVLNWNGTDPVGGTGGFQDPVEARWTLQEVQLDGTGQPIGYPNALYDLPESAWSAWKAWSAADSTGREAELRDLAPAGPAERAYVFAVQGRDDGGAITPKFDATTAQANNYGVLIADGALPVGPSLTVHALEDPISAWTFDGVGAPQIVASVATDTLSLYWDPPRTSQYGARSNGARYGWNITDTGDDTQWTAWSSNRFAAPYALGTGSSTFSVQSRDQLGQITTGVITFNQVTRRPRR